MPLNMLLISLLRPDEGKGESQVIDFLYRSQIITGENLNPFILGNSLNPESEASSLNPEPSRGFAISNVLKSLFKPLSQTQSGSAELRVIKQVNVKGKTRSQTLKTMVNSSFKFYCSKQTCIRPIFFWFSCIRRHL